MELTNLINEFKKCDIFDVGCLDRKIIGMYATVYNRINSKQLFSELKAKQARKLDNFLKEYLQQSDKIFFSRYRTQNQYQVLDTKLSLLHNFLVGIKFKNK